jgi:uncharacterized membrane protein YeaQ/YmgE (transglycosylase-associated protein family)
MRGEVKGETKGQGFPNWEFVGVVGGFLGNEFFGSACLSALKFNYYVLITAIITLNP